MLHLLAGFLRDKIMPHVNPKNKPPGLPPVATMGDRRRRTADKKGPTGGARRRMRRTMPTTAILNFCRTSTPISKRMDALNGRWRLTNTATMWRTERRKTHPRVRRAKPNIKANNPSVAPIRSTAAAATTTSATTTTTTTPASRRTIQRECTAGGVGEDVLAG